ncbi:MAG TPA: hypothetical protein RMH85_14575 [Polyangiaceae bacterium LLY-WYZ-15_(1-7)]|nr:hypothetical protein [Myxococcales bacterium]MAT27278.1 hypothetical protein [Sandaracinus sp.]HJK89686.1 hypothetical protein [Polyangiaceae bacterium LLY-WYZ-15_(1-7)]MBJ69946.1 hypothetical protein [Sandaracinus sp.]HJL04710.1 hypothetical protein [Polyangiaceae bacterium LLY-WYZ-15_(1-7)]
MADEDAGEEEAATEATGRAATADAPTGLRPRWRIPVALIVVGLFLPAVPGELLRLVAPLALWAASRAWLDASPFGRWTRVAMASAAATHVAMLGMLLWPGLLAEEARAPTLIVARLIELPWMVLYVRCGWPAAPPLERPS